MSYEPVNVSGKDRGLLPFRVTHAGRTPGFQAKQKSVSVTQSGSPLLLFQPIRAELTNVWAVLIQTMVMELLVTEFKEA